MNFDPTRLADDDRPVASDDDVLLRAEFDDAVTNYWLMGGTIALAATCVGALLIPVWFLVGKVLTRRYLASHECVLTPKALKFRKGILTRVEKTIPLDKITDLGFRQGPLMRMFSVESLAIETAGQSGAGALVQMQGIKDARSFRDAVLAQRDNIANSSSSFASHAASPTAAITDQSPVDAPAALSALGEIGETLRRIEKLLADKDAS